MPERKPRSRSTGSGTRAPRGRRSGDDGGAKGSGEAAPAEPDPSPAVDPHDPGKVEVRAGGFVTTADAVAPTPEPIIPCSVCGQTLVAEGEDGALVCPRGHGRDKSGGWRLVDEDEDGPDDDDGSDEEG